MYSQALISLKHWGLKILVLKGKESQFLTQIQLGCSVKSSLKSKFFFHRKTKQLKSELNTRNRRQCIHTIVPFIKDHHICIVRLWCLTTLSTIFHVSEKTVFVKIL